MIQWKLGDTSKKYEVGPKGGPGTISSGRGDRGGASYRHLSIFIRPRHRRSIPQAKRL